MLYSLS
jgi:hypothetical protein